MKITVYPVYTLLHAQEKTTIPHIVIDTLRMTSVAVTALHNGCERLRVVSEPEEAQALALRVDALKGGERGAMRIPGFDLSNSPLEYTKERMAGRSLIMTTSNGTRAILAAEQAGPVRLCSLINASAVADSLSGEQEVRFVLAGTNGGFSLEDAITAGAVIDRLGEANPLDDMAQAARTLYRSARSDFQRALCEIPHYRHLKNLGYQADLDWCLSEDRLRCVPTLCEDGWFRAR